MSRMTTSLIAVAVVAVASLATLVFGPRAPQLSDKTSGDAALADQARDLVGDDRGLQALHVSVITPDAVRHAGLGDVDGEPLTPETHLDLGSITKTFNGMLLADAVARGEVKLTDALGDHVPELAGTDVGKATLEELATHRSGIPSLPPSVLMRSAFMNLTGANPYLEDRATLLKECAGLARSGVGSPVYSNLGSTLLGYALADAAGAPDWRPYVKDRLLAPLGMVDTVFPATKGELPGDAAVGMTEQGRRVDPWVSEAYAPTGTSTWTTPSDIARYAQAILRSEAPGMDAVSPRADFNEGAHIGLHWIVEQLPDGRQLLWHNGMTGSASTMLVIDREAGTAVLVMGTTNRSVDALARSLLTGEPLPGRPLPALYLVGLGIGVALTALGAWRLARGRTRLALVGGAGTVLVGLVWAYISGPWSFIPGWTYGLLSGAAALTLVWGIKRWAALPATHQKHAWLAWPGAVLSAGLGVALVVAVL